MAEVQNSTQTGENAARFIEFVQMQYQNAALFLGLIPNPQSQQPEVNLDLARMFIDQLAMIGEKTRGNLSAEETKILRNALTNLQMAYFEVSQGAGAGEPEPGSPLAPAESSEAAGSAPAPAAASPAEAASAPPLADDTRESKKRFTKSYGS